MSSKIDIDLLLPFVRMYANATCGEDGECDYKEAALTLLDNPLGVRGAEAEKLARKICGKIGAYGGRKRSWQPRIVKQQQSDFPYVIEVSVGENHISVEIASNHEKSVGFRGPLARPITWKNLREFGRFQHGSRTGGRPYIGNYHEVKKMALAVAKEHQRRALRARAAH